MMKETKANEVRSFFEQPEVYLTYDYNLRLRLDTIREFIGDSYFEEVFDMPCGTGDLSIPLLDQFGDLTMMDFSGNMIAHAANHVPEEAQDKVRLIRSDFYAYGFEGRQFDLVMAIGILAHIDNPMMFLTQIARLVKPGGKLIVQNTNYASSYTKLIRLYHRVKRLVGKSNYKLNWVKESEVVSTLKNEGFELRRSFRYHQSWLGFSHLMTNEKKMEKTQKRFGTAKDPRNQKTGSDVIYLFEKTAH